MKTYMQDMIDELEIIEENESTATTTPNGDVVEGIFAKKCRCGAVTVSTYGTNPQTWSMEEALYWKNFSEVLEDGVYFSCNHCVNHWGVDLCNCGSGETPSDCECESGLAMQTLGEVQEVSQWAF